MFLTKTPDPDLKHMDPLLRDLIFRRSDLLARFFLNARAQQEYTEGHHLAAAIFFHAEMYLSDRLKYALFPPPNKLSIPAETNPQWRDRTALIIDPDDIS